MNICQVCGLGAAILRAACLVYVKDAITHIRAFCNLRFLQKGPLTNTLRIRKGATLNICQVCGLGAAILRAACLVYVKDAITRIRVFLQLTVFALTNTLRIRKGETLNICQVCGLGAAILRAACLVYVKDAITHIRAFLQLTVLWTWSDSTCGDVWSI